MRIYLTVFIVLATLGLRLEPATAQADPRLLEVLTTVRSTYSKQQRPMAIFDLDGTLFDNRHRTLRILKEYADRELQSVRPEAAKIIRGLTYDKIRYQLTETLIGAGVTEGAIVNNAAVFWSERFFEDEYLKYDKPVVGAVAYVRSLYSNGARIVYLTGRDAPRQLLGTVRSLRDNGFPIGIQGTELIMKPTAQTQDAIFKQQVTNYLRHYGKVVGTFDNEPANVNVYRRAFPSAAVFAFDAPHSPNPPPLLPDVKKFSTFE